MTLLGQIKKLCMRDSTTLAKLEKTLNFGNGTLSRWGVSSPSIDKIQKVANYFNVSIDYLIGNEETVRVIDEDNNIVVLDDETRDLIDSLRRNPEMKMLFSVSKNATKEDIIKTVKIIEALKEGE